MRTLTGIDEIESAVGTELGSSQWLIFPPPGWTLKWYAQFFSNAEWMDAALASLKVAVLTTICAVALGLPTAFALVRGRFPGRAHLDRE